MDYEKKYKDALERAKDNYDAADRADINVNSFKNTLIDLFPELKIRKELIAIFKGQIPYTSEEDGKKYIAWLEKTGEHLKFCKTIQKGKSALEAIKEEKVDNANKVKLKDYNDIDPHFGKPTNKVEPRFHEGDWVKDEQGIVHQIANVVENVTNHTYGYDIVGGGYFNDNAEGVRLWTIQDAKDGDVLCYKDEISLYKHYISTKQGKIFGGFVYHCCYDGKRFITDSLYSLTEQDKKDIHPATKEQRDLLFQKMHEAGYEWDADKKELRKIE